MSLNPKATKQELMVLRRIPSRNESDGIEIVELAEALRASIGGTYHVLSQLYAKDLIRTDTEELSGSSRKCIRTDAGDHVLMRQSAKGMREGHGISV